MKIKSSLRMLSVVLAMLMLLSVFTIIPVFADDGGTVGSLTWAFSESTETLTLSGSGTVDYNMDSAPWKAYADYIKILRVEEGITVIDSFYADSYELEEVYLPDSLISIGTDAFYSYENLYKVQFGSGLQTIGKWAFGNTDLTTVTFPDSLFYIGSRAFEDCDYLREVNFGSGLETIGSYAFANTALSRVDIPDNVTTIGEKALGYNWEEWEDSEGVTHDDYVARKAFEIVTKGSGAGYNYARSNGFAPVTRGESPSISPKSASLKAGKTKTIEVFDAAVTSWSSSNGKVAKVSQKGKVTALQKGTAKITAYLLSGSKLTCTVKVTTSPKLSKSSISVKKGKTYKVKLSGKASSIKNKYTNTKKAKITSKTTATTLTVKGLKKGTTTLKVKVNGVKTLKLKVKVK